MAQYIFKFYDPASYKIGKYIAISQDIKLDVNQVSSVDFGKFFGANGVQYGVVTIKKTS